VGFNRQFKSGPQHFNIFLAEGRFEGMQQIAVCLQNELTLGFIFRYQLPLLILICC
jgi:hypothetical protein